MLCEAAALALNPQVQKPDLSYSLDALISLNFET
jgi:hypothetical protein